jgi:gluconate:H+ symporter, GntP family
VGRDDEGAGGDRSGSGTAQGRADDQRLIWIGFDFEFQVSDFEKPVDLQLLAAFLVGVALLILLILRTRFDAFMALITASIAIALIAGVPAGETAAMIATGFGNTLAAIGIVIGFGVMIGKLLEVSGGADALAETFLRAAGRGREDVGLTVTGSVVSIPVFCDSGYVILHPLARSLARRSGRSFVTLAIALGAGLSITHHLVPPTPGPLAVAGILGVDIGALIGAGLILAIPMIPAVVFYARWIGPQLDGEVEDTIRHEVEHGPVVNPPGPASGLAAAGTGAPRPTPMRAALPLLVPILLIVGNTVTTAVAAGTDAARLMNFIGAPLVALLVGVILAVYLLVPRATDRRIVKRWLAEGAAASGMIILITGSGGALGNVLRESGVGTMIAETVVGWPFPTFVLPFLVATLVRFAQGSGTVAMITAASLTAPLLPGLDLHPLVAALAVTVGSLFFSYFNDSYFWVVTRFTGLDGTAALKAWSGITTVLWAVGFVCVAIASLIL